MSATKRSDQENYGFMKEQSEFHVPHVKIDEPEFKDVLGIISFVASIGIALSIVGSQTLACSISFMGRSDNTTMASVQYSATVFTWSACMYGLGLMVSLATQLLITSDNYQKVANGKHHKEHRPIAKYILAVKSTVALGFVMAATVLVAEGLKIAVAAAGSILQWGLLVIGVVTLIPWVIVQLLACKEKHRKNKTGTSSEVSPTTK